MIPSGYLFTFFAVLLIVVLYVNYLFTYWSRKGVPVVDYSVQVRNALEFIWQKKSYGDFAQCLYTEIRKQTGLFGGFNGIGDPIMLPVDPELIKSILTKDFHIFPDRGLWCNEVVDPFSSNLLTLKGQEWKDSRKKMANIFTPTKLKAMFETFDASLGELYNILEDSSETQKSVDIVDIMARLITDSIARFFFGLECNSLKNPKEEFRKYGQLFIDTTFSDLGWILFAAKHPKIFDFFKMKLIRNEITQYFMGLLKHTIGYREEHNITRKDFVDLFIQMKNNQFIEDDGTIKKSGKVYTFNELASQAYAFYIGAFETSSTTITFCLAEISINQDIQDEVRREILEVLGNHGGQVTYEAIGQMTYMDKVLSETLRKYPPIPMLNRQCNAKYKVPGSDVTIDKDVDCWISILGLHRDPQYYPDPDQFDPERFTEEEKEKRHPYSYIPFGEGPRMCIGMRFANLQIKICLAKILRIYKFTVDSRTKVPIELDNKGVILAPKHKIYLNVTKL